MSRGIGEAVAEGLFTPNLPLLLIPPIGTMGYLNPFFAFGLAPTLLAIVCLIIALFGGPWLVAVKLSAIYWCLAFLFGFVRKLMG